MSKFLKHFKKTIKEATRVPQEDPSMQPPIDDPTAFNQSFQNPEDASAIEAEVQGLNLDPEQKAALLEKADDYATKISGVILTTLRNLHNDIVSGVFAQIAPDIKGISGINEDLATLAESLRGRMRDAVLKSDKSEKKQ